MGFVAGKTAILTRDAVRPKVRGRGPGDLVGDSRMRTLQPIGERIEGAALLPGKDALFNGRTNGTA